MRVVTNSRGNRAMALASRAILLVLTLCCAAPKPGLGQACPRLGLNTVEEAENSFFGNQVGLAEKLLERAYLQCRNDSAVLLRIAEAYTMMGEDKQAAHFGGLAREISKGPTETAPKSVVTSLVEPEETFEIPTFVRRKHALIIGVSRFRDFGTENASLGDGESPYVKIQDLEYAAKDAEDFADALMDPEVGRFAPERVQLLTDEEVTVTNVRRAMSRIEREADEEDLVVLFFSSHGSSPELDPASSDAQSGFLMMHDTEYRDAIDTATAYPMYELNNMVSRFRAKRVVTFLDSCYSGDTIDGGGKSLDGQRGDKGLALGIREAQSLVRATPQDKARVIITSSAADERSWESDTIENGYFTEFLMHALAAEQGQAPITQIFDTMQTQVTRNVRVDKRGARQTPQFFSKPGRPTSGDGHIRIILGAPEEESAGGGAVQP